MSLITKAIAGDLAADIDAASRRVVANVECLTALIDCAYRNDGLEEFRSRLRELFQRAIEKLDQEIEEPLDRHSVLNDLPVK